MTNHTILMTETEPTNVEHGTVSVTDPVAAADGVGLGMEQRRRVHGSRAQYQEHYESDAVGRAIVGITDADDRLLLVVNREQSVAMLPNDTVASGEDWATVGREWVEGAAGIECVRRIDHESESEESPVSSVYHVVFSGTASETAIDGLCADNPFELGWYDELPISEEEGSKHIADVRLFID